MIKVCVVGKESLAAATLECCKRHFRASNELLGDIDVLWVCHDTPIGRNDQPDVEWVVERIRWEIEFLDALKITPLILISSQLPVGTIAQLEKEFPNHTFASQPENIRVKTAATDFENQARMVVGIRTHKYDALLSELLGVFTANIVWTDPETAEMSKAALNCWLGMNIAFINEISKICKVVGADVDKVSRSLLLERRISPLAPLKAGPPFGGGHLAREIYNMTELAKREGISIPIISNIKESNA